MSTMGRVGRAVGALRRALFGLGVAVAVGVVGQAAALYATGLGGPRTTAQIQAVKQLERAYILDASAQTDR